MSAERISVIIWDIHEVIIIILIPDSEYIMNNILQHLRLIWYDKWILFIPA